MVYLLIYVACWVATAVFYAWGNRGAAPVDPDPIGVGLLLGAFWPLVWVTWACAALIAALAWLLTRLTDRPKETRRG